MRQRSMAPGEPMPIAERSLSRSITRSISFANNLDGSSSASASVAAVLSGSTYGSMTLRDPVTSSFGARHG